MKLWVTDLDNTLCDTDVLEGDENKIGELELFPDAAKVFKVLVAQSIPIVVLTKGDFVYQRSKIHQIGLTEVIDNMYVAESNAEKVIYFKKILEEYGTSVEEVVMIGDRRDSEVALGKEFGAKTIWFRHGKYNEEGEAPEGVHVVESYEEVLELIPEL
tara:strand:- start:3638 stop:4111 length:474 start_codon:yes stop_codon:yes gene_type:complete